MIQVSGNSLNQTTLEITDIRGGFGGVTTDITNTGEVDAEYFTITISVEGGLFGGIDIQKTCSGCGGCSTIIGAGAVKTESTTHDGMVMGIGPIDIEVTAEALNADLVSKQASGFALGPIFLIQ